MARITIACPCPGTPHPEGDIVVLRDRLDSVSSLAIKYAVAQKMRELRAAGQTTEQGGITDPAIVWVMVAFLNQHYLIYGIESWTLVDQEGQPLLPSAEHIRTFYAEHETIASDVGDAADELYAQAVMLPLMGTASTSSRPGPINGSTSPTNGSSRKSRKHSSPSSSTSTPMTGTGTTSRPSAGGSSSSRSSGSDGG